MTTTKEKIEIMQAYVDGREIQMYDSAMKMWKTFNTGIEPNWDWAYNDYRVKPDEPEIEFRPYTKEEFISDMSEHGPMIEWLNDKDNVYYTPISVTKNNVSMARR